jgi:hypothetical protein
MKIDNEKNNYLNNFVLVNKFNEKWNILFTFFIAYFLQYKYSDLLVNFIKSIQSNKNIFLIFFIFASWFWSNLLLGFISNFLLADSIIISLLVLQNNSINHNSRRLCKNIILISLANVIGGMITLLMILFIYFEYSKLINRILFKIIKFLIKMIAYIFPPIYLLYPDIKLFNFDDPDNTLKSNTKSSYTNRKIGHKHIKNLKYNNMNQHKIKKSKKSKKSNLYDSDNSDNNSKSSKSTESSTFPTISKINSEIIKDKIKNINFSKKNNKNNIKNKKNNEKSDTCDENDLAILSKFGF